MRACVRASSGSALRKTEGKSTGSERPSKVRKITQWRDLSQDFIYIFNRKLGFCVSVKVTCLFCRREVDAEGKISLSI